MESKHIKFRQFNMDVKTIELPLLYVKMAKLKQKYPVLIQSCIERPQNISLMYSTSRNYPWRSRFVYKYSS